MQRLMEIPRREGETAFPELAGVLRLCESCKRERTSRASARRFYCQDCQSENGWLYFDREGKRLKGAALVECQDRTAKKCQCGGTDHDWAAMAREREQFPDLYGTLHDVVTALIAKRPDLEHKLRGAA